MQWKQTWLINTDVHAEVAEVQKLSNQVKGQVVKKYSTKSRITTSNSSI